MKVKKINVAVATLCVVITGIVGGIAYNGASTSEKKMLLAENIEALSQVEEGTTVKTLTCIPKNQASPKGALRTYQCEEGTDLHTIKKCAPLNNFFLVSGANQCWSSIK